MLQALEVLTCKGGSAATAAGGKSSEWCRYCSCMCMITPATRVAPYRVPPSDLLPSFKTIHVPLTVLLSLCVPAAHSKYCSSESACPAALPPPLLLLLLLLFWPLPATGLLTDSRLVKPLLLIWWLRLAAAGGVEPAAPAAAAAGRAGKPACPASRRGHSLARSSALTRPLTAASLRSCVMSCKHNRTVRQPGEDAA
jgi:hypothetical protein